MGSYLLADFVESSPGSAAQLVLTGWISREISLRGEHGLPDARVERRGRVVVQVDRRFRHLPYYTGPDQTLKDTAMAVCQHPRFALFSRCRRFPPGN